MEEVEYVLATVTCRTPGCGNLDYPAEVYLPAPADEAAVGCGVCGKPITDIVLAG